MTTYPTGDFLIRLKNASLVKRKEVESFFSKKIWSCALALKKLGYLEEVKKEKETIKVSLTFKNKKPLLINLKLVSKPGMRVYWGVSEIEKKKGPSVFLLSTPKGVVSSKEALRLKVGGEVLAEVW